jgi:hypothetical protein
MTKIPLINAGANNDLLRLNFVNLARKRQETSILPFNSICQEIVSEFGGRFVFGYAYFDNDEDATWFVLTFS